MAALRADAPGSAGSGLGARLGRPHSGASAPEGGSGSLRDRSPSARPLAPATPQPLRPPPPTPPPPPRSALFAATSLVPGRGLGIFLRPGFAFESGERVCGFGEVELALAMSLHILHEGWQHYGVEVPEHLLHRVPRELRKSRRTVVLVPTADFEDYRAEGLLADASELGALMNAALPPSEAPHGARCGL